MDAALCAAIERFGVPERRLLRILQEKHRGCVRGVIGETAEGHAQSHRSRVEGERLLGLRRRFGLGLRDRRRRRWLGGGADVVLRWGIRRERDGLIVGGG